MATDRPTLTVYSRNDCHLCDDLIGGLRILQARFPFNLTIVDIDRDAALHARYGEDVPVLLHGARELCRHALNSTLVTDYLSKIG
ncbi:MAG TPA: glutaredoxin family protein [Burkholderiales bacterium]|nr:glutaredoxin family protein [Burkholderiales bacterium]